MASLGIFRDVLAVMVVAGVMVGYTGYNRTLPLPEIGEMIDHQDLAPIDKRHVEHVILHTDSVGDIGLAISLPDPLPQGQMPMVIVLGGLDTGENNIQHIGDAGNNVIVGYDWPVPIAPPKDASFLLQTPKFYKGAINAPAQIATAIDWLSKQPWADGDRVSILGYSMGALIAPAAEDLTEQVGHMVQWTIIAYGGAPLSAVFGSDPYIKPDWMRTGLTPLVKLVFHPLEPTEHLANLSGHFLILEGKNDGLMSEDARATLRKNVPNPKSVVVFEGDHMGVGADKAELMQKIITTSRDWLTRMNAVNPL